MLVLGKGMKFEFVAAVCVEAQVGFVGEVRVS